MANDPSARPTVHELLASPLIQQYYSASTTRNSRVKAGQDVKGLRVASSPNLHGDFTAALAGTKPMRPKSILKKSSLSPTPPGAPAPGPVAGVIGSSAFLSVDIPAPTVTGQGSVAGQTPRIFHSPFSSQISSGSGSSVSVCRSFDAFESKHGVHHSDGHASDIGPSLVYSTMAAVAMAGSPAEDPVVHVSTHSITGQGRSPMTGSTTVAVVSSGPSRLSLVTRADHLVPPPAPTATHDQGTTPRSPLPAPGPAIATAPASAPVSTAPPPASTGLGPKRFARSGSAIVNKDSVTQAKAKAPSGKGMKFMAAMRGLFHRGSVTGSGATGARKVR